MEPLPLEPLPGADQPVHLSADAVELFRLENRLQFSGAVEVERGSQRLEADQVTYDRGAETIEAEGGVLLSQPGLRLLGDRARLELAAREGHVSQAHYRLTGINARGTADQAHLKGRDLSQFDNITYTTCPPGSEAWALQADRLDVDRAAGEGVARGARLRVGGVPVLYTPYFSFPLDDRRKSGLLAPTVGNSNRLGLDVKTPYYVNIAPEMDATLAPRYMSKRGLMLGAEYRFLTPSERGEFYGELVPHDRQYQDDDPRGGLTFRQQGRFGPRWGTDFNVNLVSDDRYLEDFGNELGVTSVRHLERRGDLNYFGDQWQMLARLQDFQTVDPSISPTDLPYSRLPQLLTVWNGTGLTQGLDLRVEAENVYFLHQHKEYGNRLALRPVLSAPLRRPYGHLIPRATLNHSSYWLTDRQPGLDSNPSLTVPSLSLDGGLVFERGIGWLGEGATQTLEPRLFYLYTPYQDQDELPAFDTAELDFTFASLFRDNRFSGRDRIGDANQLTLALTSRTLSDRQGRELFRGSLGQILYFQDRRVQLSGVEDDDSTSALAGELAARLGGNWSGRASLLWDPNRGDEQVRKSSVGIHYRTPERQLVNLSYRQNRSDDEDTDFEDTDLSFRWPLAQRWELVGRWLYSLRHDQTMEAFGGVEYGHCCWRTRLVARQFVVRPDEEASLSIMLQVELSGLGAFGSNIDAFLERGVYGYEVE